MGDVLTFTNPKWARLEPLYPASSEIRCVVFFNWLQVEVPRQESLSVFEHKWLDRMVGYRNHEVYDYIKDTNSLWDAKITYSLYGVCKLPENVRHKHV